ncbi:MAG: AlpA family phage regulatory protein [Alphaproteobacteria bacterium]
MGLYAMTTTSFGRARAKKAEPAIPRKIRLIGHDRLPDLGINYNSDYLRRMVKRGAFPEPVRLSPRKLAWRETDIDDWIAAKIAAAEKKSA